ncbi:MAG TPA: D-aminoacyl-tRNA deacylase, partial [Actinomycetes bacterium]|nr:D-aminoacyl-tRNA deacylase [Actinomycetes bacterium]
MRAVVSRVAWARVVADGEVTGEIGPGLLVLVGVTHGDSKAEADWLAAKVASLRVFSDDQGRMNRSVTEVGGGALVVSQFTLYGDARKGRRPSYVAAAPPELAAPLVEAVAKALAGAGVPVATGRFGAD